MSSRRTAMSRRRQSLQHTTHSHACLNTHAHGYIYKQVVAFSWGSRNSHSVFVSCEIFAVDVVLCSICVYLNIQSTGWIQFRIKYLCKMHPISVVLDKFIYTICQQKRIQLRLRVKRSFVVWLVMQKMGLITIYIVHNYTAWAFQSVQEIGWFSYFFNSAYIVSI